MELDSIGENSSVSASETVVFQAVEGYVMARVNSSAEVKHRLATVGYAHLSPEFLDPVRLGCTERQVADFVDSWNTLPRDPYIPALATAGRQRRYGRLAVLEKSIEVLPPAPFLQSKGINPVFGGIERKFAALDPTTAASPVLAGLIRLLGECLPLPDLIWPSDLGVHQIRVQTSTDSDGLPTPEGIHQDGHRFVAQVFIDRSAVEGGNSSFYEGGVAIYQACLTQPFECLLVNDRRLHHGVSPIRPAGASQGWRDMLLLDFPESSSPDALAGVSGGDERAVRPLIPEGAPGS
jgi:hypothetical protein